MLTEKGTMFKTAKGHEVYVQAVLSDGRVRVGRAEDSKTIGTYVREHFENGTFTSTGRTRTAPIQEVPVTSKKPAKPKKETAAKEGAPKKEKAPKEPQVVFAFRLSEAQREMIHKAAGPGKATKFALSAALAAATGDRTAFEELVKSSQK